MTKTYRLGKTIWNPDGIFYNWDSNFLYESELLEMGAELVKEVTNHATGEKRYEPVLSEEEEIKGLSLVSGEPPFEREVKWKINGLVEAFNTLKKTVKEIQNK